MRIAAAGVALAILVGGCGYRVAGSGGPGQGLAGGIWIGPVDDRGEEPLFGAMLGQALAAQTVDRGDMGLVRRSEASSLLDVRVDSVRQKGTAYSVGDVTREYEVTAEATATLTRPGGEPVWKGRGIEAHRPFQAGASVEETEANKAQALALLARDLSREILWRVSLAREGARP